MSYCEYESCWQLLPCLLHELTDSECLIGDLFEVEEADRTTADIPASQAPRPDVNLSAVLAQLNIEPVPMPVEVQLQSVSLAAVSVQSKDTPEEAKRFNTNNHFTHTPFVVENNVVVVDSDWWHSLPLFLRDQMMEAMTGFEMVLSPVVIPHPAQIKTSSVLGELYKVWVESFSYPFFAHLMQDVVLLPLTQSDVYVLSNLASKRVVTGRPLQEEDVEDLRPALRQGLQQCVDRMGAVFVKTSEKSAKNDRELKPKTSVISIFEELTGSLDILKQSLQWPSRGQKSIVVLPWQHHIGPHNEYRAIVHKRRVVGISQQKWYQFVPGLGDLSAAEHQARARAILELYRAISSKLIWRDCVLDVWVDAESRAHLIEVNPGLLWGASGSALFHWVNDYAILQQTDQVYYRYVVQDS